MARVAAPVQISEADLAILEQMRAGQGKDDRLRAEIVLACSTDKPIKVIAGELNISEITVRKWRNAYKKDGIAGLKTVRRAGDRTASEDQEIELQKNQDRKEPQGTQEEPTKKEGKQNSPFSSCTDQTFGSVDEMVKALLPPRDKDKTGMEMGAIAFQRGKDGKLYYRIISQGQDIPSPEDFDMETKEGFERDLSRLEEGTESLLSQLKTACLEIALESAEDSKGEK